MKVTIANDKMKFLTNLIISNNQPTDPTLEKLDDNWSAWIASPVAHHNITPKEARTILTIVGILADYGISTSTIIETILRKFVENYEEPSKI